MSKGALAYPGDEEIDGVAFLRAIVDGIARSTGDDFFPRLVQHLARTMGTSRALVSEFTPPSKIRTLALWSHGKIIDNVDYELPNTPCEAVIHGAMCHFPSGVHRDETSPGTMLARARIANATPPVVVEENAAQAPVSAA